jgi:hypothetical protein
MTRTRRHHAAVLLASLALTSCSAQQAARRAGTGDIAFRLLWDGESDLDLFVQDPAGACIFWGSRSAASGGLLDVDCNAASDRMCAAPIENVFWQKTTAPPGSYSYWVRAHSVMPGETVDFELQLLRGTEMVWRSSGLLDERSRLFGPFAYRFPGGEEPAGVAGPLPDCPFSVRDAPALAKIEELPPGSVAGAPLPPSEDLQPPVPAEPPPFRLH